MPEQGLEQPESERAGELKSKKWPGLWPRSSSIISAANLSSSDMQLESPELVVGWGRWASSWYGEPSNCTLRTQLAESLGWRPVFFCQIPRLDCSASRHRHVSDCDVSVRALSLEGVLATPAPCACCCCCCCCDCRYHRWSFALSVADSICELGPFGAFGS